MQQWDGIILTLPVLPGRHCAEGFIPFAFMSLIYLLTYISYRIAGMTLDWIGWTICRRVGLFEFGHYLSDNLGVCTWLVNEGSRIITTIVTKSGQFFLGWIKEYHFGQEND